MTGTVGTLIQFLNKTITLFDSRTGESYSATILDIKENWGKTRVQVTKNGPWFEPTAKELATATAKTIVI